jgi:hypothetical protein
MNARWYQGREAAQVSVERRKGARQSIDLFAFVRSIEGSKLLARCKILDLSEEGARLRLDCPADVPQRFLLVMSTDGRAFRRCQVKWRSATEVGVQFRRT